MQTIDTSLINGELHPKEFFPKPLKIKRLKACCHRKEKAGLGKSSLCIHKTRDTRMCDYSVIQLMFLSNKCKFRFHRGSMAPYLVEVSPSQHALHTRFAFFLPRDYNSYKSRPYDQAD